MRILLGYKRISDTILKHMESALKLIENDIEIMVIGFL